MATGATIGALRVVLGADTAAFEDGLKGAQSRMADFGATIAKSAAAMGVAVAAAATALGFAIKGAIDEADKLGKMAQSVGIPVEELSRLKHAADLSDVSLETLGKSVGRLSKAMSEIAGGGTGPAADAFRALGIQVQNTDGTLRASSEVITDIAARFGRMQDGAGKTALAMAIFGKAGADMIPLLNEGADGLRKMMNEADELGIVISGKTSSAAQEFNDNLTRLGKTKDAIILAIAGPMLSSLTALSAHFVQVAKDAKLFQTVGEGMTAFMPTVIEMALKLGLGFARLGAEIAAVVQAIQLFTAGEFSKGLAVFRAAGEETVAAFDRLKGTIESTVNALVTAPEKVNAADPGGAKLAAPVVESSKKIAEATKLANREMEKLAQEAQRAFEQSLTPAQQLQFEIQKLHNLAELGAITWETYHTRVQQIAERAGATWVQAGGSIAGSFATIADSMGKENTKMAMAAKAFAIVAAVMSAYEGASKALTLPFPANLAAAAAVLAKGFAFVAAIKSQNIPHFAEGGSFRVGGRGGRDSQFVPIMATPGEHVDIRKPGDAGDNDRRSINVTLNGDRFGQKQVREFIGMINEAVRDGARLRVVPA